MEFITWLTRTPLGLAVVLGGLLIFFLLFAVIYERKTRKLFPDQNRRGTKAVAKDKAQKKKAQESAAQKPEDEDDESDA